MKILKACGLALALLLGGASAQRECHERTYTHRKAACRRSSSRPSMSTFFVVKEGEGKPRGVTADLGDALGKKLNVPVESVLFPNSGLVDRCARSGRGRCRLHAGRRGAQEAHRVRAGLCAAAKAPTWSTAASGAKTVEDVDSAGMRVIGIANTTTIRAAGAR